MIAENPTPTVDADTLRRRMQQDEQKNAHKRRFERYPTFLIGEMSLMDTAQHFDGVVNEISQGGMRFRPASRYLQRRDGEMVTIALAGNTYSGRIRASRPDGYGVELLEMMAEARLQSLLTQD